MTDPARPPVFRDCKSWDGPRYADGVPLMPSPEGPQPVAALLLEEKLGRTLQFGEMVIFTCGNRTCVHPDHLELRRWKKEGKEKTEEEKAAARKKTRERKAERLL